jgi:hypothetical protein
MAHSPGTRLGKYVILAPLGAGGMGEVYRARDAGLGRDVAIKVLPAGLSEDPSALARFEHEARAVAALSHPNILGIFDFGKDGDTAYAVMELLEGRSLGAEIAAGEIPVRRSVDYATKIARGLAAAHEKGILHRDLKPENVFLTRDGQVKVLDFGLAKRLDTVTASHSKAPTLLQKTDPGTVLGTAGYMSPEQIRGKPLDGRSDIFSFGAVLYEMLSGLPAFRRETGSDSIAAILKEDPADLSESGRNISPALDRIVKHCLEKDPDRRFQSASDIAFHLESLSATASLSGRREPEDLSPRRRFRPRVAAIAAVAVLAGVLAGMRLSRRATMPAFQRLTFSQGTMLGARFAAAGKTVVYAAAWNGDEPHVFTTLPWQVAESRLRLPAANLLAVSTDGKLALQLDSRVYKSFERIGTLAEGSLAGGSPRQILTDVVAADWSPEAASLAAVHVVGGREQLEWPIGKVLSATDGWLSHPRISPDATRIAFLEHRPSNDGGSVVVAERDGKRRVVSSGWLSVFGLAWSPRGNEVWFTGTRSGSGRSVFAVSLSGRERLVLPNPNQLTLWDIEASGDVLLSQDEVRGAIAALPPGESRERDLPSLDYGLVRDLSPDGRQILFDETGDGGGSSGLVFVGQTDGTSAVRLGEGAAGGLSPDGAWAAAYDMGETKIVLYPTGPGPSRVLPCGEIGCAYPRFLPDGRHVVFTGARSGHGNQLWVRPIDGGPAVPISPEGIAFTARAIPSPDGRFVLALGSDSRPTLFPVEPGKPATVRGTDAKDYPLAWSADGRSIYVFNRVSNPCRVYLLDLATGERRLWKELLPPQAAGLVLVSYVIPSRDGTSYAYSFMKILSTLELVRGLN